ncbi:hypothetical protein ABPG72_018866 [Tetrahymena utriculariae]
MEKLGKTTLGNTDAKDCKLNDDIQLIMSKYKDVPPEDIRPLNIEIYYTEDHIVGFQSVYQLIDQKKKNSKKRKINDKITFELEGHKSKGSKFFSVKSEVINLGPQENISKIFGISTNQIDKISFTTDQGRSFNFPPNNPINPKEQSNRQFYFELPQLANIVGFKIGYSRFLNYLEIMYNINQPLQQKNQNFALNLNQNQSNMQVSQSIQNQKVNSNASNVLPNQQMNLYNQNSQQFGQPILQQPNFHFPPPPQIQPQPEQQNALYNYPTESQINNLNKPQAPMQQNNINNQSCQISNNQFQPNNFQNNPYNQQNIYQPYQQKQQQNLFPSLNQMNQNQNFGQQQQVQQYQLSQQYNYPPAPPPPSDQSYFDYPVMHQNNMNSNQNYQNMIQRSNTLQVSNNYESSNRQGNNPFLNGAGLISNNQQQFNQQNSGLNNQNFPLMRGQSLQVQPIKENNEAYITQELRRILFSENPLGKLTIKEHKVIQNQSSLIGMVVPAHVAYVIEVESTDQMQPNQEKVTIERRYKEFNALRECLIESLPGIPVPQIPAKQLGKKLDDKLILERKEELQIFLDEIVYFNPIFKFKGTQLFLNPKINTKTLISELEKIKDSVSGKNQKLLLIDYKRIFACIDSYQLKQSMIDEVEAFKTTIVKKQEKLEKLVSKAQQTKETMNTYYSFLNSFKKNFIKDYEEQVLQGYKLIDGKQVYVSNQNSQPQMSDQDVMVQQTHISNQRFILQYNIIIREHRILAEFIRLFSYQNQLVQNYLKLSSKLLKTKIQSESIEIQTEMNYNKWMELFITKILYFFYFSFHKRDQTKRYLKTVSSVSEIEKQNNDNMRQYWIFVMLREQIEFDKVKIQYKEKEDYLLALKVQSEIRKEEQKQKQFQQITQMQQQSQQQNTVHNQIGEQNQQQLLQSQQHQQNNYQCLPSDNQYLQQTLQDDAICNDFFNYPPVPQNQTDLEEYNRENNVQLYSYLSEEQKKNTNCQLYSNYFSHYQKPQQQEGQLSYVNVMSQIQKQISNTPQKSQQQVLSNQNQKNEEFTNEFVLQQSNQEQLFISSQSSNQVKQKLINQKNDDVFQQLFLQQLEINEIQGDQINNQENNAGAKQQENMHQSKQEAQENQYLFQQQQQYIQDQNQQQYQYQELQYQQYQQQQEEEEGHIERQLLCE